MKQPSSDTPSAGRLAAPLHVFALASLVIAQPLLDLLGRTPDFFVIRGVVGSGVAVLAALLVLGPSAIAIAFAEAAGAVAGRRGRRWVYDAALATGVAAGLLLVMKRVPGLGSWWAVGLACMLGALFPRVYRRRPAIRQLLSVLVILVLSFPVLFLFRSPARKLLTSNPDAVREASASVVDIGRPSPIVLVVFDELPVTSLLGRSGGIDGEHFPHFARFADTSTFFREARTESFFTTVALPELLTGLRNEPGSLPRAQDHPHSLFTLVGDHYDIQALEPLTALYPRTETMREASAATLLSDLAIVYLHLIAPNDLARRLPQVATTWEPFGEHTDRAADFRTFVRGMEVSDRPGLFFLHSLLPHHPWLYLPSGRRYDPGLEVFVDGMTDEHLGSRFSRWVPDAWAVVQAYQRHLLQVGFADRLLGEVLDRLEALEILDQALVIVTADHGIHFEPGGLVRQPDPSTTDSLARVPLLVKWPGQTTPRLVDRPARLVDLLPTIADTIGARQTWTWTGRSLLADGVPAPAGEDPTPNVVPPDVVPPDVVPQPRPDQRTAISEVWFRELGTGSDPFAIGPFHEQVLGQPVAAMGSGQRAAISATIDHAARYRAVDRAAPLLPARVTGRLDLASLPPAQVARPMPIALAVNGTVVATGIPREKDRRHGYFAFLLPEDALQDGANKLALFALVPREAESGEIGVQLVSIPLGREVDLEIDPAGQLRASNGERYRLDNAHFEGKVAGLFFESLAARMEFFGYAEGADGATAAAAIAVFCDDRYLTSVGLDLARSNLGRRYRLDTHEAAGFVLTLPIEEVKGTLRFFALGQDGVASELPYERRVLGSTEYNGPFSIRSD